MVKNYVYDLPIQNEHIWNTTTCYGRVSAGPFLKFHYHRVSHVIKVSHTTLDGRQVMDYSLLYGSQISKGRKKVLL